MIVNIEPELLLFCGGLGVSLVDNEDTLNYFVAV